MLNLGGGELILLGIAVLLFIPPEKLPGAARSVGRFLSQLRTTFEEVKQEITSPGASTSRQGRREGEAPSGFAGGGGDASPQKNDKPDHDKTGRS